MRPDVVDGNHVRVLERPGGPRLLLEPQDVVRVVLAGREHLQRHVAIELQVVGDEDPAHPAVPQLALDAIPIPEDLHLCSRPQAAPRTGARQCPGLSRKVRGRGRQLLPRPRAPLWSTDIRPRQWSEQRRHGRLRTQARSYRRFQRVRSRPAVSPFRVA